MDRELFNQREKKSFRQKLRNEQTNAEKLLWFQLRARRLDGWKFCRQQGVGDYIVDFYCSEAKLVIELDGDSHFEPGAQDRDNQREAFLNDNGLRVLRFTNRDIYDSIDSVIDIIRQNIS
ncbi:MAG TPA: endonuclease domain-containing protein [Patescibacteria group bacterium]|nr:endonuclease domain-containing protein [Patescibacteria group bacterium]